MRRGGIINLNAGIAKQTGPPMRSTCAACEKEPFYKNKLFIVSAVLTGLILSSYFLPFLGPFRSAFFMYISKIWWAVLLGLFLGGVIDRYIPREYVSLILAGSGKKTIFYSVILGFFMSTCSHGILALSMQLHKKGASTPAVISFLLASPWANMALTIMLIGFFGLKAFYIILSAVLIAVITGFIYQFLEGKGMVEKNANAADVEKDFSIAKDMKRRIKNYKLSVKTLKNDMIGVYKGAVSLANMILWWVLIGMTLSSLAGAYVPQSIFTSYMGPTLLGLVVTLILAAVIEVCSEGSSPMAFEIFRQTGAFGGSFVFLMAGVATDYTEIGLIWHNVGRKAAIWLPLITVPQILILGFLANVLF